MMNNNMRLLLFYIILLIANCVFGQVYYNSIELPEKTASDSMSGEISRIELIGNEKTKDYVILRELHFGEGDSPELKEIFLAQKRVLNTFLFNRVIFDVVGDINTGYILMITVTERWYVFPLPILYLNDRSWSKVSYGAKLLYYNFLGRNILLNWTAAFGYDPQFKFAYRDLWFGGDLKLLTNFQVYKSSVKSKTMLFERAEDERVGFDWLIGKRFGYYFYVLFQFGYLELRHPQITLSDDHKDFLPNFAVSLQYDNRDLKEYPHQGINASLWWRRVKYKSPINYTRYGADVRAYVPLSAYTTLALRGSAFMSDGLIPLYDRTFLGYTERIRGRFHQKYEGENLIVGGIEYRFPLLKIRYFDMEEMALPGFEEYYRNLKFGISAGLFYDYGAIWYQDETLSKKHYLYGFGGGLHFHLPYIEIFRLEIGFDKEFNHEYIAEIGIAL